jgi:hypothetical protein
MQECGAAVCVSMAGRRVNTECRGRIVSTEETNSQLHGYTAADSAAIGHSAGKKRPAPAAPTCTCTCTCTYLHPTTASAPAPASARLRLHLHWHLRLHLHTYTRTCTGTCTCAAPAHSTCTCIKLLGLNHAQRDDNGDCDW